MGKVRRGLESAHLSGCVASRVSHGTVRPVGVWYGSVRRGMLGIWLSFGVARPLARRGDVGHGVDVRGDARLGV